MKSFCGVRFFTAAILTIVIPAFAADSSIIASGAKLEKLGGGYEFTEGPAVDRDGNVFFTDQPNDRIVKWERADAKRIDMNPPRR